MALRLAGEEIAIQEKIETIIYAPGLQDSGDLEPATKTVTETTKPATPDYTTSLTVPAPSDSRLTVKQLALRGNIHIDSFGGAPQATKVYCTVECNGVEKVLAVQLTSAGVDNLFSQDITADFNLGTANQLKVYLWVDQGDAVISICQLWLAVGTNETVNLDWLVGLAHTGMLTLMWRFPRLGTGTSTMLFTEGDWAGGGCKYCQGTPSSYANDDQIWLVLAAGDVRLKARGSV
ncbi:MAG: hypothetical protein HY673_20415, partial [Chloroflexi bacterium]|nr:hypothetical protein [Chloroflexota bacterium]